MKRIICCGEALLRRLRKALQDADILDREEALGDLHGHDAGQRHGGKEHAKRDRLMTQHDIERAPVTCGQTVEARLDDP